MFFTISAFKTKIKFFGFYEGEVEEKEISSIMTNILVGNIEERTSDSIQQLPEEQRQKLISAFKDSISKDLTEKWAEQTTTRIVDDALSYLKGEQEGLTAVKNLSWQDVSI